MRLCLLDFNVWSGLTYQGLFHMRSYGDEAYRMRRYRSMIEQIHRLDPDVVCLHELNPVPEMAHRVARDLDMDVYWHIHLAGIRLGPVGIPWNLREGDAVFARRSLQLKPIGRRQLSGGWISSFASFNVQDATQVLGVSLQCGARTVPVFTTHWHAGVIPGPDIEERAKRIHEQEGVPMQQIERALAQMRENAEIRLSEARKTASFLAEHSSGFALLSGDFNSSSDSPEIRHLLDSGLRDTLAELHDDPGPTWNFAENDHQQKFYSDFDPDLYLRLNYTRLKIPHRLDYVFYRPAPDARLVRSEIVLKDRVDSFQASDHFGVLAEFEV